MRRLALAAASCVALIVASGASAQGPDLGPSISKAATPLEKSTKRQVIERIIAELRKSYVFPEVAKAAEAALREAEARGAYAATTSGEDFAERLTADLLAVTKDKHLGVSFSVEPLPPVGAAKAKDPAAMENWRRSAARSNFAIPRVEVLPGNLGYIKMTNFVPVQFAGETFAAAMRFIANTDALILDLRDNWGGDPQMVAFVLSYLVPPSTHLNDFYNRVDGTTTQVWSLPLVPGGAYGTERPVYVLTNSVTISAAEEVAYDLQQLKRGTVVGEKTAGAANPGGSIRINDHFAVFVPVGRAINPISKTNWEGVGVIPDVPANSDQALDVAVRLALKEVAARGAGSPASN